MVTMNQTIPTMPIRDVAAGVDNLVTFFQWRSS